MTSYHKHKKVKLHKALITKKQRHPLFIDRLTFTVALIEPAITIPQLYVIFRDKTAEGIALSSWVGYQLFTIVWLWYGIAHKDKVIIVYQIMWLVLQQIIIIGGIMYGAKWF